jgi:recombination protein RecA
MIQLQTARLLIRGLEITDLDSLYAICGDPLVMRFVGNNQPLSLEQTRLWIETAQSTYPHNYGCLAVLEQQSNRLVGYCGLVVGEDTNEIELIYGFATDVWGQGYALEAARAILDYGCIHFPTIHATADPENHASLHILTRLGFRPTRRIRIKLPTFQNPITYRSARKEHTMSSSSKKKEIEQNTDDLSPTQLAAHKKKALESAMSQIEKAFGKNAIMRLDASSKLQVEVIPTGSMSLDLALGVGGVPKGRVIEIYGPESGGKTTLTLTIAAQCQKLGGTVAFIDAEHALDPVYAKALGVNTDELLVSQPDTGEQALEIAELLVRSGAVDMVVIDSVAALVPRAEIEGEMGDSLPGLQARLMSQALRKLTAILNKSNTTMIFINQVREKIGVMYGNPETTTGGKALKFYASVRLDIRRIGQPIKVGNDAVGNNVKIKVVKNKVAPPFKEIEVQIYFGKGIDQLNDLVNLASSLEILEKAGSWFSYQGERIGQGKEKVVEYIKARPTLEDELRAKVFDAIRSGKGDSLMSVTAPSED